MRKWRRNSLELCWYPGDGEYSDARGLVWSNDPIYCAASVFVKDDWASISISGLHGLSEEEYASLLSFLKEYYPG